MDKISTTITKSTIKSPNLELLASKVEKKIKPQKKKSYNEKSISLFKQLIVTTAIVFSFGGLGFGLALRYSNVLSAQNIPLDHISSQN